MGDTIEKEMGFSRADVRRLLPRALVNGESLTPLDDDTFEIADGARRVTLKMGPDRERQIGLMKFQALDVTLAFDGHDKPSRDAFLHAFERAFQRGGG